MPVLGGDLEGKGEPEEVVDDGRDGPAVLDGKRAVLGSVRGGSNSAINGDFHNTTYWRAKVFLKVDNDERRDKGSLAHHGGRPSCSSARERRVIRKQDHVLSDAADFCC